MSNKEEVIADLSQKSDPRCIKWENRAVMDTLQEIDLCTIAELLENINIKYECELFTYNSLYSNIRGLIDAGAIQKNPLTNKLSINPEYITKEVHYLPISNYSVAVFALSVVALIASVYFQYMVITGVVTVVIGALYLLAQHLGSEFRTWLDKCKRGKHDRY